MAKKTSADEATAEMEIQTEKAETAEKGKEQSVTMTMSQFTALIDEAVNKQLAAVGFGVKDDLEDLQEEENILKAQIERDAAVANRASKELVPIRLFYDGKQYKDPLSVSVNGTHYLIRRGETVMVPRFIRDIIENSERQDRAAADLVQYQQERLERMKDEV